MSCCYNNKTRSGVPSNYTLQADRAGRAQNLHQQNRGHFTPCTSNFVAVMMGIKKVKQVQTSHQSQSYPLNCRRKKVGQRIFIVSLDVCSLKYVAYIQLIFLFSQTDWGKHTSVSSRVSMPHNNLPGPADGRHCPQSETWVSAAMNLNLCGNKRLPDAGLCL